jgi:acyl-CoA thioester hydrolase
VTGPRKRGLASSLREHRGEYRLAIPTRWNDNDVYGHVNNVEYYAFFDTVINAYLIREGGLDIHGGDVVGLCAESHCEFQHELAFPETVTAGLRVGSLGNSSVRYEIALYGEAGNKAATGWFVHVFVNRDTRRPAEIPPRLRSALEALSGPPSAP